MPVRPAAPPRSPQTVRQDLTAALATCVTEKGYAATTIADVVAVARVSKRTFYEHFADKQACLIALYVHVCDRLVVLIRGATAPGDPWPRRVEDTVTAYLSALDAMPDFTRALLVEMQAAGPKAFRVRQDTMRKFARTLVAMVESGRPANPEIPPLRQPQALGLVGAINELLLAAVDPYGTEGREPSPTGGACMALRDDVIALVAAVLTYRPEAYPG